MNSIEAIDTVHYMKKIWPNWKPTDEEMDVWADKFRGHDEQTAVRAIKEAKFRTNFNSPPAKEINSLLKEYHPTTQRLNVEQPEPTVFLFYEGGGPGTLQAGYFAPVIPGKKTEMPKAIESMKMHMIETYGGAWKVYMETNHRAMIKMRNEARASQVDKKAG